MEESREPGEEAPEDVVIAEPEQVGLPPPLQTTAAVAPVAAKGALTLEQLWDRALPVIARSLPPGVLPERIFSIAVTARQRTPLLLQCSDLSVLRGIIIGAQLGLDVSGVNGLGYLVPRFNKTSGKYEAQFQIGYRGMIELALRSGKVIAIYAKEVYQKDEFRYESGTVEQIHHKQYMGSDDAGEILGAYAVAVFPSGYRQPEVMSRAQIDAIRGRSQADNKGFSPWSTDYAMMARKTVIRRLCKTLPQSSELNEGLYFEDMAEAVGQRLEGFDDAIETEAEVSPQIAEGETRTDQVVRQIKRRGPRGPYKKRG